MQDEFIDPQLAEDITISRRELAEDKRARYGEKSDRARQTSKRQSVNIRYRHQRMEADIAATDKLNEIENYKEKRANEYKKLANRIRDAKNSKTVIGGKSMGQVLQLSKDAAHELDLIDESTGEVTTDKKRLEDAAQLALGKAFLWERMELQPQLQDELDRDLKLGKYAEQHGETAKADEGNADDGKMPTAKPKPTAKPENEPKPAPAPTAIKNGLGIDDAVDLGDATDEFTALAGQMWYARDLEESVTHAEDAAYADAVIKDDEKHKGRSFESGVYTAPAPARDGTPVASAKTSALKMVKSISDGIAKVKQARAATDKILADFSSKPIPIENVISILSNRFHAKPVGARSRYRTYALDFATEDGQTFTLRLSDHSAHSTEFNKHGSNGDFNISVVVNNRDEDTTLRDKHNDVILTQYTYAKEDFKNPADVRKLIESVKGLFDNGKYVDLTGKAIVDTSGKAHPTQAEWQKLDGEQRYSVRVTPEQDAAYADAVKRGDKETALRMIREAAAKAMPKTKVVDKDGLPLVVYHGTNKQFNSFDPSLVGKFDTGTKMDWSGEEPIAAKDNMFFFTSNSDVAADHADGAVEYEGGNSRTVGVFINAENPLEKEVDKFHAERKYWDAQLWYDRNTAELQKDIAKNGNDALIVRNPVREGDILVGTANPNAIKSADITYDDAGNLIPLSDRFNPSKDDIRWNARDLEDHTDEEKQAHNLIIGVKMVNLFASKGYKDFDQFARTFAKLAPDAYRAARDYVPGMWLTARITGAKINPVEESAGTNYMAMMPEQRTLEFSKNLDAYVNAYNGAGEGLADKADQLQNVIVAMSNQELMKQAADFQQYDRNAQNDPIHHMRMMFKKELVSRGALTDEDMAELTLWYSRDLEEAVTPEMDAVRYKNGDWTVRSDTLASRHDALMAGDAEYRAVYERFHRPDGSVLPGWLKAPNGQPSKLDPVQYVQVRTPAFKEWFGDWEKKATVDAILGDEAISSDGALIKMPGAEQRKEAKALYDEIKSRGSVRTLDGRDVKFTSTGFKEIKHHSADPHTLAIVPVLREVISSAHFIGDGKEEVVNGNRMKYHLYARKVNLGDGEMVARIVLREDVNGNIFYDEESTSVENIREIVNSVAREPNTGRKTQSPYAANSIAKFFHESQIAAANASKVVDENGEPLVVYRGASFDPLKQPSGKGIIKQLERITVRAHAWCADLLSQLIEAPGVLRFLTFHAAANGNGVHDLLAVCETNR